MPLSSEGKHGVSNLSESIFSRHSEVKYTKGNRKIEMFKQWFKCRGRSFLIFNKLMGYIYISYKHAVLKPLCSEVKDIVLGSIPFDYW